VQGSVSASLSNISAKICTKTQDTICPKAITIIRQQRRAHRIDWADVQPALDVIPKIVHVDVIDCDQEHGWNPHGAFYAASPKQKKIKPTFFCSELINKHTNMTKLTHKNHFLLQKSFFKSNLHACQNLCVCEKKS